MQGNLKSNGQRGWAAAALAAMLLPLAACAQTTPAVPPSGAIVRLTTVSGEVVGQAVLTPVPDGVEIVINVEKQTPGLHGFHIHATGTCAPGTDAAGKPVAFGAAGGHFDPDGTGQHGQPNQPMHHAGDAPNLEVGGDGRGTLRYVSQHVSLQAGKNSVLGRALVVHADPDDYKTNPAGNSGGRVLCGVIQPARMDGVRG